MYPVFEPGQKVFLSDRCNDWEKINRELWVCILVDLSC